jgi:DNA-binding response OmpR family regulator
VADHEFIGKILIVDDDQGLRETLADFFSREGFDTLEAGNVSDARAHLLAGAPDLLLLDLNMPGGNGLGFAAEVRAGGQTPIIIISGKGQMIDRVVGLEVGADDYLVKPFELRELLARVRAVLRRAQVKPARTDAGPASRGRVAEFGGVFSLDPARRQLSVRGGVVVDLTAAEYNFLAAFVDRPNRILTRDAIADLVHSEADAFDRSIDTLVSRLRRKLEPHADSARLIQTVRGEGYVLASDVVWTGKPAV